MDERNPASQLSEATPSLFPQVISLGPTVRPPRREVIGQVPYRSTLFFLRERGHQPGPTVQPPPLSGLVTQRERESSAMVPTVRPLAKRPPPTDKKGTPSFFFFASPKTRRPIYKQRVSLQGKTRRIKPPGPHDQTTRTRERKWRNRTMPPRKNNPAS